MLVSLVGGRAAEEIVFDTVTTGAANDIEKATNIAKSMVTEYGMSKKFGLIGLASVQNKYLDGAATLNCSDTTAAEIDAEVVAILKESYEKALELLKDNRELMDKLAEYLIEKETITGKEFMEIFRREKGLPDPKEEKAEDAAHVSVDITVTDETSHSSDSKPEDQQSGSSLPEVTLPQAPVIPGEQQDPGTEQCGERQRPEAESTGEPSQEPKAEPSGERKDAPPTGPTGRFSGGSL